MLKKKVREMLMTKLLSIMITASLVLTSVHGLAFSAPIAAVPMMNAAEMNGVLSKSIIPFNIGRITDAEYNGGSKTVVTIQDLHSHKQTQENISSILNVLDKKYGIKNIYLEGAGGTVDTSWINSIANKDLREKAINELLAQGRLTGGELYSIRNNKPNVIKGLENEKVYLKNLDRLNEIYKKKAEIQSYLKDIKAVLDAKTEQYYGRENTRLNRIQERNRKGEVRAEKYLYSIIKAADRAHINLAKYDQIVKYVRLIDKQKEINFEKINKEIKEILKELKEVVSYQEYKGLIEKVNNRETETEFYREILRLGQEKGILTGYDQAIRFMEYLVYNEELNPIDLAIQEQELIQEIEQRQALTGYEKEVIFVKGYYDLIEKYLSNKITASEYKYFKNNEERFKELWAKYVDIDGIIDIEQYFNLFNEFYRDNVERNRYFIEAIKGEKPNKEQDGIRIRANIDHKTRVIEELEKEKGIDVVITGGFHTEGIGRIMEEEGINYVVITPNITEETVTSEKLYEQMFRDSYEIVGQKFANMPISKVIEIAKGSLEIRGDRVYVRLADGQEKEISEAVEAETAEESLSGKDAAKTAEAFIALQEYLKQNRERARKGEAKLAAPQELISKINQVKNEDLRAVFNKEIGADNSLQAASTSRKLLNLGISRTSVLGVALGVFFEPFVVFWSDFNELHGGTLTQTQKIARAAIGITDVAVLMVVGLITMNVIPMIAGVYIADFIAHFAYNLYSIKSGREEDTFQTGINDVVPDEKVNIFDEEKINALIEKIIAEHGKDWSEAAKSIFRRTRLEYVEQLKAKASGETSTQLIIGENFTPLTELSPEDLLSANVVQLAEMLGNEGYLKEARNVIVDVCLMNGGIGSSIKRDNLIAAAQLFNREMALAEKIEDKAQRDAKIAELQESLKKLTFLDKDLSRETVKYGAKADDLFFVVTDKDGNTRLKSIMNIKLDKILADKASGMYKDVKMVMLVSPESRELVQQLYDNNPEMKQALDADMEQQDMYPVVQYNEETGEINFLVSENSPKAPGGHGVWLATLMSRIVKKTLKGASVSIIGNSDALASGPIAELIGYMSKEKVGISIVSVDRENIDRKGGVFGLLSKEVKDANGRVIETIQVPTILELAQAKAAGQAGLFEELGFRPGDNAQPFNSNTVFVNDVIMQGLYKGLMEIFTAQGMSQQQAQAEFDKLMLPDLITNAKEKNGIEYVQLEGALGSSVLNMNAKLEVLRRQNKDINDLMNSLLGKNKPLVQIVNANSDLRNTVFTPVKFASDFWIQFTNGTIENDTWVSLSPKGHGAVNVAASNREKKTQYTDVSYFLQYWRNVDIRELNNLIVDGDDVKMNNIIFKGNVNIVNNGSSEVMLSPETLAKFGFETVNGKVVLENVTITADKNGNLSVRKDLGAEFNALRTALENLRKENTKTNRQALKDAIEAANKVGIDIKNDPAYREKLDILLSAVIQDHSYKSDVSSYYWDEEARAIFRNQRIEFVERQRQGAAEDVNIGENFFLPPIADRTGMTPQSLMDKMGVVSLSSILSNDGYRQAAKDANFIDAQMNGGIGSSVERIDWLRAKKVYEAMQSARTVDEMQEILVNLSFLDQDEEIAKQQAQLSAKGSDLYFRVNVGTEENPKWELLSITDVKLSSLLEKKKQYNSVSVVMLTSPTSEEIVDKLYGQISRKDKDKTNKEIINGKKGENILEVFSDNDIAKLARISQASYPSVRLEDGKFSLALDKEAPGGHGVWLKTLSEKIKAVDAAIVCISNSDAVNSGTPVEVSGYMLQEKKGVVVLVATREDIDRKGGIVGLKKVTLKDGREIFVPGIMELAQAKSSKNKENAKMFTEMGFGQYEGTVPFNTNTVLINAGLLQGFLKELKGILSPEEYASLMSPDLMANPKSGYIQLEGALGSSVFNMNERLEVMRNEGNKEVDALLNKYFPNGMIGLVLANKEQRTKIFTPFKFAVDFWIQSVSGKIDTETMAWESGRKEAVNINAPAKSKIDGKEKNTVYADVYYLLRYWRDCVIDDLANLIINENLSDEQKFGIIKMKNITLKGNVRINNAAKEELLLRPDLLEPLGLAKDSNGNVILENVSIDAYEKDGKIILSVSELIDKDTVDETSAKEYITRLATVSEFGRNDMYIVPVKAQEQRFSPAAAAQSVISDAIKNINDWFTVQALKIISLFKGNTEVLAVVDAKDTKAIKEAEELAARGVKVRMIILNDNTATGLEGMMATDESGKILQDKGLGNLYELRKDAGNLEIIMHEPVKGQRADGKAIVSTLLQDIQDQSRTDEEYKRVVYVSSSLLDGQEDILDSYEQDRTILASSTASIQGAIIKGLLEYGNIKEEVLRAITVATSNIYGSYRLNDINENVIRDLKQKNIGSVILDISDLKGSKDSYSSDIVNAVNLLRANDISVVLQGSLVSELMQDEFKDSEGITEAVDYSAQNVKETQKRIIDYTSALKLIGKEDLRGIIVDINSDEKENIILTPENMKKIVNSGAEIAFDGKVLEEVSKDSTSVEGITMLDLVKAMFADTPETKAKKARAKGIRYGREIIADALRNGKNVSDIFDDDYSKGYILEMIKMRDISTLSAMVIIGEHGRIAELINPDVYSTKGETPLQQLFGDRSLDEIIGILEGMLQAAELAKVSDNIIDIEKAGNVNEIMEKLAEYKLLTGSSFNANAQNIPEELREMTPEQIMKELEKRLENSRATAEQKAVALSGIIELLLSEQLQIDVQLEKMLDLKPEQIHALLSAA